MDDVFDDVGVFERKLSFLVNWQNGLGSGSLDWPVFGDVCFECVDVRRRRLDELLGFFLKLVDSHEKSLGCLGNILEDLQSECR